MARLKKEQIAVIKTLKKYPNERIMSTGYLTGGNCIARIKYYVLISLMDMKIIQDGQLTEYGKKISEII